MLSANSVEEASAARTDRRRIGFMEIHGIGFEGRRAIPTRTPRRRHARCDLIRQSYDAIIPFNRSFTIFSRGLFADAPSHSRTLATLTVCVTLGLRALTSICLVGPGRQRCSP